MKWTRLKVGQRRKLDEVHVLVGVVVCLIDRDLAGQIPARPSPAPSELSSAARLRRDR